MGVMRVTGRDWETGILTSLGYVVSWCLPFRKEECFRNQGKSDLIYFLISRFTNKKLLPKPQIQKLVMSLAMSFYLFLNFSRVLGSEVQY